MEENLQKALAEIINKVTQGVESGVEFLGNEIPDVIHQLLTLRLYMMLFSAFTSLCFIVGWVVLCYKVLAPVYKKDTDNPAAPILGVISFILMVPYAVFTLIYSLEQALYVVIAPKIYLIEYASKLLKQAI